MESQKSQSGSQLPSSATNPAITSCRKKKSEEASFLVDLRDHIDEFVNASMDEHKTCFKKTIQKVSDFRVSPSTQLGSFHWDWYIYNRHSSMHLCNLWFISDVWNVEDCK